MDSFQAESKHGDWLLLVAGEGWSLHCYTEELIRRPRQADPARSLMNNLNVDDDDSALVAMFAPLGEYTVKSNIVFV